jgi:hypothetical protein
LSRICGAQDVITRITKEDEVLRQQLGYRAPQNSLLPFRAYRVVDWFRALRERKRRRYVNHVGAALIRRGVGEKIWSTYFKFTFERNPFDRAISDYYWRTRKPRPAICDFLHSSPSHLLSNWGLYTIDDEIAVDFVGRYENIKEHTAIVMERLGLSEKLELPRAKGSFREDRRHYSRVLSAQARARIERVCAREILAFDYRWRQSPGD